MEYGMIRRLLLIASVLCLVGVGAVGCSTPPEKKDDSLTQVEERVPAFFEHIPATTPYVMTSLEPFPMEVLEPYMSTYGELYESLSKYMQQQQQQTNYQQNMEPAEKFSLALFEELSKARTVEGYKKLGFSTRPQAAIYGIGWFPVMRMTLGNAKAFEGMISRLETKSGLDVKMRTLGQQTYRQYDLGEEGKVALAVTDDEVIIGGAPNEAFDEFIAYMLGQKKPARSLADVNVIQDIRTKYDFMPYAIGYVDVVGLAGSISGAAPGDQITRSMLAAIEYDAPEMTEVCRQEYMSLFEKVPRAVLGYTALSSDVVEVTMVAETEGDFSKNLAKTAAPIPAYGGEIVDNAFAAVGLGVDMQKLVGFASQLASKVKQDPYQCPDFQPWNDAAGQAEMMSQMIPPFVTSLRGVMAVVNDVQIDPQRFKPTDVEGLALVQTGNPAALFSQLQMYVPHLQGVEVQPDGIPVALAPIPDAKWAQVPHVAMDTDTLAASAGVGAQDEMAVLLEAGGSAPSEDSPLMVISYDYGKWTKMMAQQTSATGTQGPLVGAMDMMQKMFGTFVGEVDANDDGIVLRYRLNMFPEQAAATP
jgi:hypothetical protein